MKDTASIDYYSGDIPRIGDVPKVESPAWEKITRKEVNDLIATYKTKHKSISRKAAKKRLLAKKHQELIPRGADISYALTNAPRQIVYGRARVGGILFCMHQTGQYKEALNLIIGIAGHEIDAVEKLYIDDIEITFPNPITPTGGQWANGPTVDGRAFSGKVFLSVHCLGATDQTADPHAMQQMPDIWTTDHRCRGIATPYIQLRWDGETFPEGGLPEISFLVRGKKVYDPRTLTTAWSDNAALCLAGHAMDAIYGLGETLAEQDAADLSQAADDCDEQIELKSGGTEPRYTINGYFDSDSTPKEVLEQMCAAFAGKSFIANGLRKYRPGVWRTPIETALGIDDLRGAVTLKTMVSRRENFNSVRGTYIAADKDYEATDYPAVSVSAYVSADNNRVAWEDLPLHFFTTSGTMAQRIARIALERIRRANSISARWGLKTYPLEEGDVVPVTLDRYGFSETTYEVTDYSAGIDDTGEPSVELELNETDEYVFSWDPSIDEQEVHDAPDTTLPSVGVVETPTNLTLASGTAHLDIRVDGTVFSRIYVSWTAPADAFVTSGGKIEIQYKKSADSSWNDHTSVPGDQEHAYILDVQDGVNYDVRIRAVNALGVIGDYTTVSNHTVLGKGEPPSDVANFTYIKEQNGIRLSWDEITDFDRAEYEIREGEDWASGTKIFNGKATNFLWDFQLAGTHHLWIKAIDTSGNPSDEATALDVEVSPPGPVAQLRGWAIDSNVVVDWQEPIAIDQPLVGYRVYRGGTRQLIAWPAGTFYSRPEVANGTYPFIVTAVDAAGNESAESTVSVFVYQPTAYKLHYDQFLDFGSATISNVLVTYGNGLSGPCSLTETIADHFGDNVTFADMIADGYTLLGQPVTEPGGSAQVVVDLGATVASTIISLLFDATIVGAADVTTNIEVSADGTSWVLFEGVREAMAMNFRYIKVTFLLTSDSELSSVYIPQIRLQLRVRKESDSGSATISDTTGDGTEIFFNKKYLEVTDINAQALGTAAVKEMVNFSGGANPTSFKVLLFDLDGNRVTGDVYWDSEGLISGA